MYKKLSAKEREIMRRSVDPSSEPPSAGKAVRGMILFGVIFLIFVLAGYLIVSLTVKSGF